jgi:HSP20 family molecular chaperone IbpA
MEVTEMAEETKAMEIEKQEMVPSEESERTRETRCFVPRADIFETEDKIFVLTDMPGVSAESLDITLEKNVLTINGYVEPEIPEGYSLAWAEYRIGDYERSFRISDEIDRDKIEATIKSGVLHLELPKAAAAKTRRISVKTA